MNDLNALLNGQGWFDTPQSSNVARFRYDGEEGRLTVEFKNGSVYAYYSVPPSVVRGFAEAGSKGHFVWAVLRHGYAYRLLRAGVPGRKVRVAVPGPGSRLPRR